MPYPVSREAALEAVLGTVPLGGCPMCFVRDRVPPFPTLLAENEAAILTLNEYPLRWGHLLVSLRSHKTAFSQLDATEHAEASSLVHLAASILEDALAPPRVFVASLGAPEEGLRVTTPHLHWHVLPISHDDDRARDIFTWQNGVLGGTAEEWDELREKLRASLARAIAQPR